MYIIIEWNYSIRENFGREIVCEFSTILPNDQLCQILVNLPPFVLHSISAF